MVKEPVLTGGQFRRSTSSSSCADEDASVSLTNMGHCQEVEEEEEGTQNEKCICSLEETKCGVCVCMNKRYTVVSRRSHTDELDIFNAFLCSHADTHTGLLRLERWSDLGRLAGGQICSSAYEAADRKRRSQTAALI